MCPFDYTVVAVSGKVGPVNQVNHTSWVAVVTPTDRHKSVRNRCVIELFCGVVCVVTLPFWHFCWCMGFCHRTESDLFLFLMKFCTDEVLVVCSTRQCYSGKCVTNGGHTCFWLVPLLLSNCCLDFKENCRKKILEVNCVLFMLFRTQRWPERFLIGWNTFQFSATATPNGQGFL